MTISTAARLRERDREETTDRPAPEGVDPDEFAWPDDAPLRHQLVATGVTSHVYNAGQECIGHVAMAEYDDADPERAISAATSLPWDAVVLRSSPRNYHVVGLAVRPWGDVLDAVRSTDPSDSYLSEMERQGRFVLRDAPKYRKTGDVYKPAPEPVYLSSGSERTALSQPHLSVVRQLADDAGRDGLRASMGTMAGVHPVVGETTTRSTYESMTDELRDLLRDDG